MSVSIVAVVSGFQPTLPARGATRFTTVRCAPCAFQPTLPARGATLLCYHFSRRKGISTHAPRTGSDPNQDGRTPGKDRFQPTLPARGATGPPPLFAPQRREFQPTLPARGATRPLAAHQPDVSISTHAPRTGSDAGGAEAPPVGIISTHAPRTGSDLQVGLYLNVKQHFNPRSPHGERQSPFAPSASTWHFNPRSPHGERRGFPP